MRTLMTLITLGAAGAGYIYLQQTPAAGEYDTARSAAPSLFDWNRDAASRPDVAQVPVKDLIGRIHQQTKSALDDFANQHGGHSDAPVDNAFERLRQVAQSAVISPNPYNGSNQGVTEWSKTSSDSLPNLQELQRTAFDPAAEAGTSDGMDNNKVERSAPRSEPFTPPKTPAIQSTTGNIEHTNSSSGSNAVQPSKPNKVESQVSTISQVGPNPPLKRNARRVAAEWKVVGKTTEGRPMHSMHLGENGTRTLVIAGLSGTDRTAVRWLELLAEELARHPEFLDDNEVVFFRAGNPDGLTRNETNNSRGVPLNRNFPGRRYRPASDMPSFAVPAGEVETRVMLDTFYTFRPRRVIHLTATSGRSQVLYNRAATSIANDLERSVKLTLMPLDAEQLPGSVEDFADGTLEAAVLSMRLSVGNDWQKAWTTFQSSALSAVVGRASSNESAQPFDPDRTPIPNANIEPVSSNPGRRGYEELPPPPGR